jgi:ribosomal protein L31E
MVASAGSKRPRVLRSERTYKAVEKLLDRHMKAELVHPSRATAMKFLNKIADAILKPGVGAAVKRAK